MNNFLLLQEDDEQAFNNSSQNDRVYSQIESQLSVLRFFGSVFNMYVPVMADTVISVAGGGQVSIPSNSLTSYGKGNSGNSSAEPSGPNSIDNDPIR